MGKQTTASISENEMPACSGLMFFETPSGTIPLVIWCPASNYTRKEADFMEF
jgi:hypothetical protein